MAGWADAFGSFAQGAATGTQAGLQVGQRNRALDIQEKIAEQDGLLKMAETVDRFSKWGPEMRKAAAPNFVKALEKSFNFTMDPSIKDALIKGDDTVIANVTQAFATGIKNRTPVAQIIKELSETNDPRKVLEISEKLYGHLLKPEKELQLKEKEVAISGANAATSRMNAETTRAASMTAITTGRILSQITDFDLKGQEPPEGLIKAGERLGLDLKGRKTVTVPPGHSVIDSRTNQVLFTAPDASKAISVPPGHSVINPQTREVIFTAPETKADKLDSFTTSQEVNVGGHVIAKGDRFSGTISKDGKKIQATFEGPDGKPITVEIPSALGIKTTVQSGTAAPEGSEARSRLTNQQDAVDLAIKDAMGLSKFIDTGIRTGTTGSFARFLQGTVGQSQQFLDFVGLARSDAAKRLGDAEAKWLFDPRLPTAQLLENALVYRYAATMAPGNERVPLEVLRQVKERLGMTEGWQNDPKTAKAKVAEVLRQLGQTRQQLQKRLKEDTSPVLRTKPFDATKD